MVTCCGFSTWTTPQHQHGSADYSRFDAINPLEKLETGNPQLISSSTTQTILVKINNKPSCMTLLFWAFSRQNTSITRMTCLLAGANCNCIWGFKSPPAAKHASGRTRSTHGSIHNSPLKAAKRRIPSTVHCFVDTTLTAAMKPNINKPVPGAKEFYPLNEPSIGTTMSPVRVYAIV